MNDVIYVVKIGVHEFMTVDQHHAFDLVRQLSATTAVNCKYTPDEYTETVSAAKPVAIALEVKPKSVLSED